MRYIRIGSSHCCEIKYDAFPCDSVWVKIYEDENHLFVLQKVDDSVLCCVNDNVVTDKYWIRYGDEVIINNFILDWHVIAKFFSVGSTAQEKMGKAAPCVYGPPMPTQCDMVNRSHNSTSISLLKKTRWKIIGILTVILGGLIIGTGYAVKSYKRYSLKEKLENTPVLYGPQLMSEDEQERIRNMQDRIKEVTDSIAK